MSERYKQLFNILEVFEKNNYQKILMGTKASNSDDVVVINIFNKSDILNSEFMSNLKNSLSNLIHIEESENEIIAVTEYKEGTSLSNYLSEEKFTVDEINKLSNEYLSNITKYNDFDNYFKNIFVNENQIIVKNSHIHLNELLIIDDSINSITPFNAVTSKIISVLDKINSNAEGKKSENVTNLINELNENPTEYLSFNAIKNKFLEGLNLNSSNNKLKATGSIAATSVLSKSIANSLSKKETKNDDSSIDKDNKNYEVNEDFKDNNSNTYQEEFNTQNESSNKLEENSINDDKVTSYNDDDTDIKENVQNSNSENMELELDSLREIPEDENPKEKNKSSKIIVFALLGLLFAAAFIFLSPIFNKKEPPIASYERSTVKDSIKFTNTSKVFGKDNKIVSAVWTVYKGEDVLYTSDKLESLLLNFKSEGEYVVTLKVKDSNDLWSDIYKETFVYTKETLDPIDEDGDNAEAEIKEKLDKFDITYDTNVLDDFEIYRSGSHSIKLDLTKNDGKATLNLDNISIDKNYIISMWIMSDNTNEIKIEFTGLNSNEIKFKKIISYTPKAENVWEMVKVKVNTSNVNKLKIDFTSPNSTLWIDDIEIESYK